MPTYEFRCRSCGSTFEERRPMAAASEPATCPEGHADVVRLMSAVAVAGGGLVGKDLMAGAARRAEGGGGCCGGGCCG